MTNINAAEGGRKLYHAIWALVEQTFFDTSRLADWASWEHRFDDRIVDEATALAVADEMLASLNDTYTERVVPPAVVSVPDGNATAGGAAEKPDDVMAVLTPSNIGYLRISSFDTDDVATKVAEAVAKIAGADGIILDLRQNGGGRMHVALEVCNYFIDNGLLATLKFREEGGVKVRQYFVNETQFFATEELPDGTKTTEMYERRAPVLAGKPIAIIINRRTASAGELMVCALVQNGTMGKVTIVGSGTTPGKGIGQAEYEILDGAVTVRVTRTHWFAPGGEWLGDCGQTEANGIEPWILVENDRGPEGLKAANDELRKLLDGLRQEPAA